MANAAQYEKPFAIRDSAGNVIYEGALLYLSDVMSVINTAAAAMNRGDAVLLDPTVTTGTLPPKWGYAATGADIIPKTQLCGLRIATAADIGYLGVALEKIPVGYVGKVAGTGSIVNVNVGTITSNVRGNAIIGSTLAGLADAVTTNPPAKGISLGMVYLVGGANATAIPNGTSGSATELTALVAPH
jgi:hypothetical protein